MEEDGGRGNIQSSRGGPGTWAASAALSEPLPAHPAGTQEQDGMYGRERGRDVEGAQVDQGLVNKLGLGYTQVPCVKRL